MAYSPMSAVDSSITKELTQHLFEKKGRPFSGLDLAALNLQRGREHGLPGYAEYLRFCSRFFTPDSFPKLYHISQSEILDFADLKGIIRDSVLPLLQKVYEHAEDIDLFTGGLSEIPMPGAIVGPTFGCLLGIQFQHLRMCDRFWYETPDAKIGFTLDQLASLKKVTLASLMCHNWDVPSPIQRWVLDMSDAVNNPLLNCTQNSHPMVDLSHWRGEDPRYRDLQTDESCDIGGKIVKAGGQLIYSACTRCTCLPKGSFVCSSEIVMSCTDLIDNFGIAAVAIDEACEAQCPDTVQLRDSILHQNSGPYSGSFRVNVSNLLF